MTENESKPSDLLKPSDKAGAAPGVSVGFGCAGLYGLPTKRGRRAVLEFAYDLGIRHFDSAPIYGLGLAEAELADFVGKHNDVTVTTKFGLTPTNIGRLAGLMQAPVRRLFRVFPEARNKAKASGSGPTAGAVGRVLYSSHNYTVANAQRALTASLRTLKRERIDFFMLHGPAGALQDDYRYLVDYLEDERLKGVIRYWGPAGDLSRMDANTRGLTDRASALQFPYDLINGYGGPHPEIRRPTITFGFLAGVLPRVRAALAADAEFRRRCSDLLDADFTDDQTVVRLLVRNAVTHNRFGTVMLSSTSTSNLESAWKAVDAPMRNEAKIANMIRQRCVGIGCES